MSQRQHMRVRTIAFYLLGLLLCGAAAQASVILAVNPPDNTVNVGDSLTVNVDIDSDDRVFGFSMDIDYPTFLTYEGMQEQGLFATDGCCFGVLDTSTPGHLGFIYDALVGSYDPLSGPDTLFSINFTVNGAGSGEIAIDPSSVLISDDSLNQIPVQSITPATVTAAAAQVAAPEPSSFALMALAIAGGLWRRRTIHKSEAR